MIFYNHRNPKELIRMGRWDGIQQAIDEKMKYLCPNCNEYALELIRVDLANCHSNGCTVNDSTTIEELIDNENYDGGFSEWELFEL
jgi:hypothetical protein